jgi:hypothetical protein
MIIDKETKRDLFTWLDIHGHMITSKSPHCDIKERLHSDFTKFIVRNSHDFKDFPKWKIDLIFDDFWTNRDFINWGRE